MSFLTAIALPALLLGLDVFSHGLLAHVTDGGDVVSTRPEAATSSVMTLQAGKGSEQFYRADAFEGADDVHRGDALICFYEHVNVIIHRFERFYLVVVVFRYLADELFQFFLDFIVEDVVPEFGTPYDVVLAARFCVIVTHCCLLSGLRAGISLLGLDA